MFRAIPSEERCVALAPDTVSVGASSSLIDGRFCVHRCGDVHAMFFDCESKGLAFRRTRQEAATLVFVACKTFFLEKTLLFGDVNCNPVADMIVNIGDEKTLIENTHSDSPFPSSLFSERRKL